MCPGGWASQWGESEQGECASRAKEGRRRGEEEEGRLTLRVHIL